MTWSSARKYSSRPSPALTVRWEGFIVRPLAASSPGRHLNWRSGCSISRDVPMRLNQFDASTQVTSGTRRFSVMTRTLLRLLAVMAIVVAAPSLATAQSLAGTVRDTSGAVLPGVPVEASSAALITQVRTGVTDETGQYRIPDLPPGTYKVTFTLTGFGTVVREGVELTGGGVMTIGAEMRVGGLAESITVTGESPVVDVQTARQQTVIDGDIVRALPASRSYGNYIAAVPAIQATGFGGGAATTNNFFSV